MRSAWRRRAFCLPVAALLTTSAFAENVLFDATKHEMAGNADWVIDADGFDLNMPAYPCTGSTNESRPPRFPTPAQAGITAATPETYWTGGISSWAVDLVKAGHTVESLPPGAAITYGDGANPQDLSHYQLFILVEPQNPFTAAEKAAILAFVSAGGGLFLVADHETSDRDCDGWDAPHVYNDLTGATSAAATGVFGIWFRVDGSENQGSDDWFDDAVDANVETSSSDPIINGPFGSGTGGLGLFGSTSMDVNPADNDSVTPHVWRTGQPHGNLRVTFATAVYGAGRVAAIGDSSPADDDTGDPSDSLHPGWDKAGGGVANKQIHLNACHWLLNPAPDVTPPAILSGPAASFFDCSASISWTTDEAATSIVEYGPDASYGSSASTPGTTPTHVVAVAGLSPETAYHYRVSSSDAVGNGPTQSSDQFFTTTVAAPPSIVAGPVVGQIGCCEAVVSWTTDEPATSAVEYGPTPAYGGSAGSPGLSTSHAVTVSGLSAETQYHFRVASSDACANGPAVSLDATFTTGPNAIDVSGWTLKQQASAQTFVIPAGTSIPSGGYLVVGRDASRAQFETVFPSMPAGTIYLNSNAAGSCSAGCFPLINGDETFELLNSSSSSIDGPTIPMSTTHLSYQRTAPAAPAGSSGSWSTVSESSATPGTGAGAGSASGVRINEMSDAVDFANEFIELYYDTTPAGPDTGPPAAVTNLDAVPQGSASIALTWTATGDDGSTGTAASYDVRRSGSRILTNADFAAATPVAGAPTPKPSGQAETMTVSGLSPDTAYYFALKVIDDIGNLSALSNSASAVTGPPGGGSSVNHLVISQIRTAGTGDDVIEIFNPTANPISIANTSIQYLAANGNFGFRVNLTGANSVPAYGWYLAAANGYVSAPTATRDDSLGAQNLAATAGHALLVGKTTNVTGCTDVAIIDKVGYGVTATCPEGGSGHAATSPATVIVSVTRKPNDASGNGQDTEVNNDDFLAPAAFSFHNRFSTPASPPAALGSVQNTLFLAKSGGTAVLTWAAASGATGYRVYRGAAPGFMSGSPAPWATPSVHTVTDGEAGVPVWFYLVRATDGTSESPN